MTHLRAIVCYIYFKMRMGNTSERVSALPIVLLLFLFLYSAAFIAMQVLKHFGWNTLAEAYQRRSVTFSMVLFVPPLLLLASWLEKQYTDSASNLKWAQAFAEIGKSRMGLFVVGAVVTILGFFILAILITRWK